MYEKEKEDIRLLQNRINDIEALARNNSRELSEKERNFRGQLLDQIRDIQMSLPEASVTMPGNGATATHAEPLKDDDPGPFRLRGPQDRKDYRTLFGNHGANWTDQNSNFFQAVCSGRFHPQLINNMTESVSSDGGFLVPVQYSEKIHAVSLENEIVSPRCYVLPMTSNECHLPGLEIGNHSSNLYGGFTASYTGETKEINEANPKARGMQLTAKKLTGLIRFSSELASDIPGGTTQLVNICGKGLSWYRDKAFLKGTGAGQPLGILNANCLIEVTPETGQSENTILYENLTKMMARMFSGSFQNSVWVCHQSTIPQLLGLYLAVGVGGSSIPVLKESNGLFTILTRPVIFTEKTEPLGTKGDIMLADFSQYIVGLRNEMKFDLSIHAHFTTDELLARLIERHDGQPLWDKALTLEDGVTTVSPFVVLGAR